MKSLRCNSVHSRVTFLSTVLLFSNTLVFGSSAHSIYIVNDLSALILLSCCSCDIMYLQLTLNTNIVVIVNCLPPVGNTPMHHQGTTFHNTLRTINYVVSQNQYAYRVVYCLYIISISSLISHVFVCSLYLVPVSLLLFVHSSLLYAVILIRAI